MNLRIDLLADLATLVALWIAISEVRRNNKTLVELRSCRGGARANYRENGGRLFVEFSAVIRNQGVALYDPTLVLSFRDPRGPGRVEYPLKRKGSKDGGADVFSRGMIAEFYLKSYEIHPAFLGSLCGLTDPPAQDTCLVLYSQGFSAKVWRAGKLRDRFAAEWNSLAGRFNRKFGHKVGEELKEVRILPGDLPDLSLQLRLFVNEIKELSAKDKPGPVTSAPSPADDTRMSGMDTGTS